MPLSSQTIEEISRHATAEYPSECCGMITGIGSVQRVHRLINIQDRLHALDPLTHPLDSKTAYAADRNAINRVVAEATWNGETIDAFYHSHIDCDAYFSSMDKDVQTVLGEPEFPEALQVVISVMQGNLWCIKAFRWNGTKRDFIEVETR